MEKTMPTVLVVDDEMLIRWAVSESLSASGFAVLQAGSAAEAIDQVLGRVGRIGVALLDLRLPDSTDFELMHRIKAIVPGCQVIMMTADSNPTILNEAMDAGAFSAVAKPFDMGVMSALILRASAA
jgi:DNA-binding NtrC family response regulator